mgnify:CR=1 FL=1
MQNVIYINVNPIAFTIGPVTVGWYGIMVALAVVSLVAWAMFNARRDPKISYDTVINAALVGIPSAIIFSRLLHVIDYWEYFMANPGKIIGGEGLTIYGAVLGAAIGVWAYSRFSKKSFGYLADMLAPGIIFAQAIGRVGCVLNGCCHGVATDLPWAFVYTHPLSDAALGIPVHPTHAYEILFNLLVFTGLVLLRKRLQPDGSLFLVYLAAYAAWRIGIDFIRDGRELLFGLHEAQLIGIAVLIVCTVLFIVLKTRRVSREELAAEPPAALEETGEPDPQDTPDST